MTTLSFRVQTYARAVYVYGTNRLTFRDGFPGVADGYYTATQEYAATGRVNGVLVSVGFTGYTKEQLDLALASGWINQQEYDETIAMTVE
jgi:hypothetical protein